MKALKKFASNLFAIVVCVSMLVAPTAAFAADSATSSAGAQSGTYVFDERGLFSSTEFDTLESQAQELASKYNMGVYFLTTDYMNGKSDPSASQRTDYATTFYKEHKLGLNPGSDGYGDGIMFVVAADSRDYVTIAYGQGSYSFSDKGISSMEDAVTSYLSDKNWYGAAQAYYSEVGKQLAYYASHGTAQKPLGMFDWIIRILIIVGIPLVVTFVVINNGINAMKTAKEQSEASHYLDSDSLQVISSNDQFVNTSLAVTPKPKNNDSGGGGWGGGGGGGFSSSGGGKF